MRPFDLDILLWPAGAIFVLSLLVTFRVTRNPAAAILAALLKSGIFLVYFGGLFDGTFTFFDDWSYLSGGKELLARDVGVSSLSDDWDFVLMTGRGNHFVYYLYNTYAFRVFGEGYFAPVAANILLTVLIAFIGTRLAVREFGLSKPLSKWFYLFVLFHPDILAWSNIMNGKDVLVLLLHVLLLMSVSLLYERRLRDAVLLAVPVVLVLFFLRFYVPLLFMLVLVTGMLSMGRIRGRFGYLLLSGIFAVLAIVWIGTSSVRNALNAQYVIQAIQGDFVNPVYGFVRMMLTPIPFHTEPSYAFLNIPALIHWLLMPFVFLGILRLTRTHTPFIRFFLLYLLVFMGLYAVFGELQGPRHRVQLDYAWAVLQFLGVMVAMRRGRGDKREPVEAVVP